MTLDGVLLELAKDGAWTAKQLAARLVTWPCLSVNAYVTTTVEPLRRTAYARHRQAVEVVRLNARGAGIAKARGVSVQVIRTGELEHALGLAELRYRCGIPYDWYTSQDGLGRLHRRQTARGGVGLGSRLADGVFATDQGAVLCEYDHGRYTAKQVKTKLAAFQTIAKSNGAPIVGAVWGVPTADRAAWLRSLGVKDVIVMESGTWLT